MRYFSRILVFAYTITFCLANIEDRLLELEAVAQIQFAKNENLKNRVKELESEVTDLVESEAGETELQEVSTNKHWHLPEVVNISTEHVFKRAGGITPAFHAYLSTSKCHNDRETLVFDAEALDEGGFGDVGVYDKRDGIFEPPSSGVYVFTWTIAAPAQAKFLTELLVGGNMVGVTTTDSDITQGDGSGVHPATAVVVAQVTAGTHCYIRVRHNDGCATVLSDNNIVRTTFSAWKLFSQ